VSGSRARRLGIVAGAIVVLLVLAAAAAVGGYAITGAVRGPTARASATPVAAPSAYADATGSPSPSTATAAPAATPAGVARALGALRAAAGLGGRLTGQVRDVSSGAMLFSQGPTVAGAPASTAKLLTAAAILTVHKPTDRFTTRVLAGPGGAVTLVGGGDPTLTGAAAGKPGHYRGAARISDLAARLRSAGVTPSRIVVDDSLFTVPTVSPNWAAEDVPSSYASPITALMVDGGRAAPDAAILSTNPDLAAGKALARALGQPTLPVTRGTAVAGARTLAAVESAPVSTLVTEMLQLSDNVIAECLGRQVAISQGRAASFTGAAAAIRSVLERLGIDPGTGMSDASGLAARDRLSARTLVDVVRLIADTGPAQLRGIISALPVAGWSGTLADRYLSGGARAGAGAVRAKTGTLTGVSTLAGVVHDRSGRALAFAFLADRAGATPSAEAALDALAARLASCGCGS